MGKGVQNSDLSWEVVLFLRDCILFCGFSLGDSLALVIVISAGPVVSKEGISQVYVPSCSSEM